MSTTAFCSFISPRAQRIARAGSSTDLDVKGSLHLEKMLMLDEEINDLTLMGGISQTRRLVKRDVFHTWSLFTNLLSAQLCIQCNRRILVKRATYRCSACKSMVHLRCRVHAASAICPLKQPIKTFKQNTCTEYDVGEQYSSTEFLSLPRNDPTKRKGKVQLQSPYSKWGSKNHAQKNRSDTESALKTKYKQVKGGIKRTMRSFRSKVNKAKETLSESFTKHEAFKDGGDSFLSFIENERKCEEMDIVDSEGVRERQFQSDRGYQGFRRNHSKPKLESETQVKERELDQEMDCSDDPQSHQRDSFKRHEFQCDRDIDLILDRLDEVEVKVQRLEAKIPEELECWRKLVQKYRNEDEMEAYFKNKENDDDIQTNNSESENMHSLDSGSMLGSDSDSHNSDPAFIIHNSGLSAKQASIRPAKQMDLPLQPRQLNFRLQKDTKQVEKDGIKEKTTSTPINGHGIFLSPNESGKSAIRVKNITHFVMDKTEKTISDHRRAQTENGFGIQNRIDTHRVLQSNCNTRQKEYKDTRNKTGQHRDIVITEESSNTRQKEYKDTRNKTGQHRDIFKTEEGKGDLLMYEDDMEEHRKRKDAFKQGLQIVLQNFARGKLDYDASVRSIKQAGTWSRETIKVDDDYKVKEEYTAAKASPNPLASSTIEQDSVKFSTLNPSSPFSVTFRNDESLFETGHSISYSNISVNSSPKTHSGGTDGGNLHKVFISPDQNKSGKLHADSVEAHVSKESVERVKVCTEEISLTHVTDLPVGQTFNSFCCDWPVKSKTCKSDSSLADAADTYISKFCASKEYFEHQIGESKGTAQSAYQKSEQYFEQQSIKSKGISQSAYQKSKEYFEKMNLEHMESNQVNIDKKGKDNHDRLSLKRQSSGGYGKPVMVISPNQGNESQDKSPSSFPSMGLQSLIEDLERHLPFSTRSFQNLSSPRGEATKKLQECNYVDKGYKEQGKDVIDCMKHCSLESDKHSLDVKLHVETGTEETASTKNKGDGSLAESSAGSESNGDSWGFEKSEREKREIVPKRIPDVENKFSDLVLYMTDSSVQAAKCELQESANESEERFSGRSVVDKPPYPGKVQRKKSQNIGIQATEFGAYRGKERSSNAKYHFLNSTGMVKICSPKLKLLSEKLTSESHAIIENSGTGEDPLENELQTISSNSRHHCRDDQVTEQKKNNLIEESDNNLCTDESDEVDSESDKIEKSSASQCSSDEGQGKQQIDHKAPQIVDTNCEELPSGWEITSKKGVIREDHNLVDIHNSAVKATDSMEISSSPDTNGDFLEQQGEKILDVDGTLQQEAEMMHHMEVSTSLDQNLMTKEMSQTSESEQQSEDGWDDSQEAEEMAQLDQFNEILDEGLQSLDPILQWVQTQEFNSHVPEFRMMLTPKMDPCDNQTHFRNMSPSERGFQLPEMILFQQSGIEPTFVPSPDIGGDNKAVNPALEGCNKADTLQDESIDFIM